MATRIRPLTLIYGKDDLKSLPPDPPPREGPALLSFHLAPRKEAYDFRDVVALLKADGIRTGTIRARNPITGKQWWIPVTALAAAATPYGEDPRLRRECLAQRTTRATGALGERPIEGYGEFGGRCERLLAALTKHEEQLGLLHVTKARKKLGKNRAAPTTKRRRS